MVRSVVVERELRSSPEDLYHLFAHTEIFNQVRGIRVKPLSGGVSGVGEQRRVSLPGGYLVEEILGLVPSRRFDYRIRAASLPFRHEHGCISFAPGQTGSGASVEWVTRFSVPAGRLSPLIESMAARVTAGVLGLALRHIDRHVCRRST